MKEKEYTDFRNDYFIFEVLLASFLIIKLSKNKAEQVGISLFVEKLAEISPRILNEDVNLINQAIQERETLYKKYIKSGDMV